MVSSSHPKVSLPYDWWSMPLSFSSSCSSMAAPSLMVHGSRFSLFYLATPTHT
jgi:hypothetical protein